MYNGGMDRLIAVNTLLPLSPGDLVFDLGANRGNYTAGFVKKGCRVIAVEPQLAVHERLYYRFKKMRQVTCVCAAVADKPGEAVLHLNGGSTYISGPFVPDFQKGNFPTQKCKVVTIDALISRYGMPRAIKMDVEGHEAKALRGLSFPIEMMTMEFHSCNMEKLPICLDLLERFGEYKYNIVRNGDRGCYEFLKWLARPHLEMHAVGMPLVWDVHAIRT